MPQKKKATEKDIQRELEKTTKLLLKIKGEEVSKSDNECVYLYAWCTLLRYLLISFVAKILS